MKIALLLVFGVLCTFSVAHAATVTPSGADDTEAFQLAFDQGGEIVLGPGQYNIGTVQITKSVLLRGSGSGVTILSGGTIVISCSLVTVRDIEFTGFSTAINITVPAAGVRLQNLSFYYGKPGCTCIAVTAAVADLHISDCLGDSNTEQGCGVYITNGGNINLYHCQWLHCNYGAILAAGNGAFINAVMFDHCLFDTGNNGILISASSGGKVTWTQIDNTWVGTSAVNGITVSTSGTGQVCGVQINGGQIITAGNGIAVNDNINSTDIDVNGTYIAACSLSGIYFGTGVSNDTVKNAKIGAVDAAPGNQYGITFAGGNQGVIVTGNFLVGNGAPLGGVIPCGPNNLIADNLPKK